MSLIYILLLATLIIVWLRAKVSKVNVPPVETGYSRAFLAPAVLIYMWWKRVLSQKNTGRSVVAGKSIRNRKLLTNLQTLYPGDTPDRRLDTYRIEIISTVMLIMGVGCMICLAVSWMSADQRVLQDGDVIYRSTYGGMNVDADLSAGVAVDDSYDEYPMQISVPAQVYSREQAERLFNELSPKVDVLLLGNNDRPDHILYPVDLIKNVDGYPFSISWTSSDYELLDYDGVIHNEELTEPRIVTVTGDCSYRKDHWYIVRDLRICPQELTAEESIAEELAEAVAAADKESESSDRLTLPTAFSFGTVTWEEEIDDMSPLILMGVIMVCIILIPFKESEINSRLKVRSRELLIEYPAFVSQLTLYLGAGMSVRNCLLRLGKKAGSIESGNRSYLDKELLIAAHELEVGISESEVIEHFSKRCGTREYMRFGALLIQNMKKGSTDLMAMLKEESEDAFALRKNEARKLGEEASTKMLLPMVMMLTVVMIIIMVPAYMSFSS